MRDYNDWTGTVTMKNGKEIVYALSMCADEERGAFIRLAETHGQMVDCCGTLPAVTMAVRKPTAADRRNLSF